MKKYLFCFLLIAVAKGEIYDISIPENDTASYNYADFRIWVNDSTDTLRGIYWFMHPNNGDSRDIVTDSAYQSLVNSQSFALLGAHIFYMHMYRIISVFYAYVYCDKPFFCDIVKKMSKY